MFNDIESGLDGSFEVKGATGEVELEEAVRAGAVSEEPAIEFFNSLGVIVDIF